MRSGNQQRFVKLVAVVAALLAVSSCSMLDKGDDAGSGSESESESDETAPTQAPSVTVDPIAADNALVADCVQWVQTAAFSGQPQMQTLWTQVGQDPAALSTRCTSMLVDQRLLLQQMSTQLAVVNASVVQPPTTDPAAPADPAVPAAEPAPPSSVAPTGDAVPPPDPLIEPSPPAPQTDVLPAIH